MSTYVGPAPENTCPPGTGQTFTEELGRHCVEFVIQHTDTLAVTGSAVDVGGWIVAALMLVSGGLLVWYNATKRKE